MPEAHAVTGATDSSGGERASSRHTSRLQTMAQSLKLQRALGNIAEGLRVSDDGGWAIDKASKWPLP